ncbi:MAG: NTP transferase domain-containing protein [Desulfatitalea sp.]
MASTLGVVILAAGLGTRMKSDKAKVLHKICGRPMIDYVVRTAIEVAGSNIVVVVGHQAEQVKQAVGRVGKALFANQEKQLGTGHAVLCALPFIPAAVDQVVVLCGDVPLIRTTTIAALTADHDLHQRDVSLLAVSVENPKGYGRVIFDAQGQLTSIVEEKDADAAQKLIKNINSGIYVVKRQFLQQALPQLRSDNAQNEIYLTDIVDFGYRQNRRIGAVTGSDSNEIIGVNSRDELQIAEKLMKLRDSEKS